MAHLISSSQ